jgi:hypothetical protein
MGSILKSITFVFLLWVALTQCTERIEIELDQSFTRLVIDGGLTNDSAHHMVRLTTSTGYFVNQEPPPVKGANIVFNDGIKQFTLNELNDQPGYYAFPVKYALTPGTTCRIYIKLKESVGGVQNYSATTQMADTRFRLDSIQMEYNERFDFWLVKVYALDPPTKDFYKFDTYLNGINGNDTVSRSTATPDRFFNGNYTNGFAVAFFEGELLTTGDTITLAMSAITEDFYNFYSELRSESGFRNPLFAGPPANIRSNLVEGGLGYFWTRNVQRVSLIVPGLREEN